MSQLIDNEDIRELDSRDATEIVGDCYKELSQYVTRTRAYASATDGLKAVYRRVIYASRVYSKKVKSASIVGEALKYHPHGDASVYDALVQMTCEYNWFPLFDGKGNFGGQGFCFTGDTKISLLDGREVAIRDIHEEFQRGNTDLWVYSSNEDGKIYPRRILNTFDNGVRPVMKVVLDNGEEIRCTLNHNFMLRDGTYVEAQNLKSGDSLMPLYRIQNSKGYELVKDNSTEEYILTHRLDLDLVEGYADLYGSGRRVVHHKNGNKHNNNPTNLLGMTWQDHTKYHNDHCDRFLHTEEAQRRAAEGVKRYFRGLSDEERKRFTEHLRTDEVLEKCKEGIHRYWDNLTDEEKKQRCIGRPEVLREFWSTLSDEEKLVIWSKNILDPEVREKAYQNGIGREDIKEIAYIRGIGSMDYESRCDRAKKGAATNLEKDSDYYKKLAANGGWKKARDNNPHSTMRGRILKTYQQYLEMYSDSDITPYQWESASRARGNGRGASYKSLMKYFGSVENMINAYYEKYNHKVDHIEFLGTEERVYDIETDEFHNFALSAGVIVHNSPAAMRYTEATLSELARLMYLELIDYAEYIDGEAGMREPKYLPALIPYCLLVGAGGIPVGMPVASIPPLNALDLVNYYIDILEKKPNPILPIPDFGEIILNCNREEYINPLLTSGQGRLWFNGVIIQEDENKFVVCTATPSCSFPKLRDKVQNWIDQDILDYTDETDSNGSRHVFTITNPSKLSSKTLKDKLEKTMKCSLNYNFIVEYNDGAKQCGINFIISKNLKYLRECAVRKYESYSSRSNRQLLVLQAIEDYKNSGYLDEISKMSSDEVKAIIVGLGYEDSIASEAIKKPITYLTKSHAKEIEDLKNDIKSYENYIQNPDEYLLTLYYRMRDMILPIYSKRDHSVILDEMDKIKPKKAKFYANQKKLIISDSRRGIKFNRNLYLVSDDGTVTSRYVSNRIDNEIDLSLDEHDYRHLVGDNGHYMVIVVGKHIVVKKLSELQGSRQRFKPWDGVPVDNVFIVNGPKVKIVDERGNEDEYNLPNWEKSRISYPSKATKYDIKDIYDI